MLSDRSRASEQTSFQLMPLLQAFLDYFSIQHTGQNLMSIHLFLHVGCCIGTGSWWRIKRKDLDERLNSFFFVVSLAHDQLYSFAVRCCDRLIEHEVENKLSQIFHLITCIKFTRFLIAGDMYYWMIIEISFVNHNLSAQ